MNYTNLFQPIDDVLTQKDGQIQSLTTQVNDLNADVKELNRQAIAQRVIGVALCFDMENIPYLYGGEYENDGKFDCSAMMQVCFRTGTQGAVNLPRTSYQQATVGIAVPFDQIAPGDTLHYDFDGDGHITHVGMAMDHETMIHTNNPTLNINIIKIADYNRSKLVAVRRHIL